MRCGQVALYSRQELMLRTTSNFLLSLAAFLEPCRPFLKKYFCAAVRLPTDWIEVAELYQVSTGSPGQVTGSPGHEVGM